MLKTKGDDFSGKVVSISGSGNVAQFACEKATQLGAEVVTMSDSKGFIHDPSGIDEEKLAWIMDLKTIEEGGLKNMQIILMELLFMKMKNLGVLKLMLHCLAPLKMN